MSTLLAYITTLSHTQGNSSPSCFSLESRQKIKHTKIHTFSCSFEDLSIWIDSDFCPSCFVSNLIWPCTFLYIGKTLSNLPFLPYYSLLETTRPTHISFTNFTRARLHLLGRLPWVVWVNFVSLGVPWLS